MTRWCIIGPTYPFRGGIAHYTTLLAQQLRISNETLLISFTRQYPRWLYPGRSDRDPSKQPLKTEALYLIDPVNPLTWWKTLRQIKAWQADVVLLPWWVPFWAPAWSMIGRGIRRMKDRPMVIFICHNVLPHDGSKIDKVALRLALASGDGFIVHSKADGVVLHDCFPQANIKVSPLPTFGKLGQDSQPVFPLNLPRDCSILIFFGFIRPYKGLDTLLDALALVKKAVHLLVVGEFWEGQAKYEDQIDRLNLGGRVTLVNEYVPDELLGAYISKSDVAVLPYKSATQSAVVQVAFGHNVPVITTDVGGLPEAVIDGQTGLIVPAQNPIALAAAIDRFIGEDLGSQFRKNIQQETERFSWRGLTDSINDLINQGY